MISEISANAFYDDQAIKITITGNGAVGKTSLCQQLTTGTIPGTYDLTIGCDIHQKKMEVVENKHVSLVLWDLAGQDRFESVRPTFYKGSHAAVVVFDLTSRGSFYDVRSWVREIRRNAPQTPFVLVGNKSDKGNEDLREVSREEAEELAHELKVPYLETSALDGSNVESVFQEATKLALTINNPRRDPRFLAY